MWLFAVVAFGLWVLLEKSPLGRAIMLIGSNERATHYSGINTRRVLMWVYVISALLCAVAAFLMMSKLNSAKASYGESYLLVSILAGGARRRESGWRQRAHRRDGARAVPAADR